LKWECQQELHIKIQQVWAMLIMHNMMLRSHVDYEVFAEDLPPEQEPNDSEELDMEALRRGYAKRDIIMQQLWEART
jgi:hypothetical protein